MIQANVRSTQTMVNQRATEIRFKELTLFTDNLGVIASLAAFFAETSLESLYIEPETVSKESATNHFSTLAWILSSVTISLNLLTLLVGRRLGGRRLHLALPPGDVVEAQGAGSFGLREGHEAEAARPAVGVLADLRFLDRPGGLKGSIRIESRAFH